MKNNLLQKFASFSFGTWIGLIIGVISTPIITRLFSPEDFARASMFNLAINILMVFTMFATDQAYVRFFYEEKEEKRSFLLKNILKIPMLVFVITSILILIFRKKVSNYLFDKEYIDIVYLLVISILIYILNRFATLVVRMEQNGKVYSILQICMKLFELIGILLFVKIFGNGFRNLIYARVLTMLLVGIVAVYYGINHWKFFKKKVITRHSMKDIIKYSSPLVLTMMITWLFQSFDRFAIKEWSTMKELGIYVAGFRIVAILNIIQTTFSTFWTPVTFEHYEKNPKDTYFYTQINKLITIIMIIVAIGTIMFKNIIALLLGKEFREATMIIPFLVLMPIMYTISETTVGGINFKKKVNCHLIISIASCLSNIIGNYYLVPLYGGKGAAISTGLAYIIFFSLRTYFSLRYYKVNYNLKSFYFYTLLVSLYALYNTFYNNYLISGILGIFLLIIIVIIEFKFIKSQINRIKNKERKK